VYCFDLYLLAIFHILNPSLYFDFILCIDLQDSQPVYNLFGSIDHSGFSPDSGHYYAYVKVIGYSFSI
jgi:hypothetical protein